MKSSVDNSLPEHLVKHPLFSGEHSTGMVTADHPKYDPIDLGGNSKLEKLMSADALDFEPTRG